MCDCSYFTSCTQHFDTQKLVKQIIFSVFPLYFFSVVWLTESKVFGEEIEKKQNRLRCDYMNFPPMVKVVLPVPFPLLPVHRGL